MHLRLVRSARSPGKTRGSSPSLRERSKTISPGRTWRRRRNAPTPTTGPTSQRSAAVTDSRRCPPLLRRSRSISNRSRRRKVSRWRDYGRARRGCRSRRYGGASPRSPANTRLKSLRRPQIIRWSRNSYDDTAAPAGRRRRTRSRSSAFQQF